MLATGWILERISVEIIPQILLLLRFIFYPWVDSNFTTFISIGYCIGSYRHYHSSYLSIYTKLRGVQRQISVILIFIIMRTSSWTDYTTNAQIAKELKITPILDKLLEYKRNWIQHVNRMPRNRLPRIMKHYSPTGRRNHERPLKRLLDT